MIGQWAPITKAYNTSIAPLLGSSNSHLNSRDSSYPLPILAALTPTPSSLKVSATGFSSTGICNTKLNLTLDDDAVIEEMRRCITNVMFSESMGGMSADAQLFLGKVPWCSPGMVWSDIDHFVPLLSRILKEDDRLQNHVTLRIDVFHAEHDNMVGRKGAQWFDNCWSKHPSYQYSSEIIAGTDHDYLLDPAFGASVTWLQRVRDAIPRPMRDNGNSLATKKTLSRRTWSIQRTLVWVKRLSRKLHRH